MPLPIIESKAKTAIKQMVERNHGDAVAARKIAAERRLLILQGQWKGLAQSYLAPLYATDAARSAVQKRVKVTANVLAQVCRQVCVAYERQPLRKLEGATEEQSKAFAKVTREAQIGIHGKEWERKTFAMCTTVVVPVIRSGRLHYMHLLPHCFEVVVDEDDPMGTPLALVIEMQDASDRRANRMKYAVLDSEAWHFYDERSQVISAPTYHNAGVFPGTLFRLSTPTDDWYDQFRMDGLVDATLEVAHLRARMDWVRFHQDRFKEILFTEQVARLTDQVVSAEGPAEVPINPGDAEWVLKDANLSIANARAHIRDHIEAACEAFGIPVSSVDVSHLVESVSPLGHLLSHQATEKIRADNVGYLALAEADLHWKSALVMRGMGHPLANSLPADVVKRTFEIEYTAAPFLQDPKTQLEVDKGLVDQGLASTYQIYMRRHPGLTLEEAIKQVNEIAAHEAQLNDEYIKRGPPKDSELRRASREQLLGTIGGQRSGEARNTTTEDETQ